MLDVMSTEPPSERTRVRRKPARGAYDREAIHAILDEALVAHLGFVHVGQPYVIPTLHARVAERVYFHGSQANRTLRALGAGTPVCLTASLVDGLVLARSAVHHSVNYRSVVVFGEAEAITDPDEHLAALEAFTERVLPGRWREVRPPTVNERKGVAVLSLALDEASAKVRSGPPLDDDEDYALDVWAGVIPLRTSLEAPVPDPRLSPDVAPSSAVERLLGEGGRRFGAT
jgi:nitroimidazol reductase NimA-like FMN-containing flavoprotein (pyridoxamine 5'-phosphate oxidase superfamily)